MKTLALLGATLLMSMVSAVGAPLHTESASMRLDGRAVTAWYPTDVDHPLPLVLFSHGFGGANIQSGTLMRSIAGAGYLVLAPNHKDAAEWLGGEGKANPQANFGDPDSWTEKTYRDRFQDLLAVYRAIPKDAKLSKLYKAGPVILAGHSLGGYTVLGMAGARPEWASEIKPAGVLAFSPYLYPYIRSGAMAGLKAPVMYQGGTKDSWITPSVSQANGAYDQTPTAKSFISFEGAGHLAWTELSKTFQQGISSYTVAFCDRYAKGQPREILSKKMPGVADFRTSER